MLQYTELYPECSDMFDVLDSFKNFKVTDQISVTKIATGVNNFSECNLSYI